MFHYSSHCFSSNAYSLYLDFFSSKSSANRRKQQAVLEASDDDEDSAPPAAGQKKSAGKGGRRRSAGPDRAVKATGLEPDLWPKVYCLDIDYLVVARAAVR